MENMEKMDQSLKHGPAAESQCSCSMCIGIRMGNEQNVCYVYNCNIMLWY